MLSRLRDFVRTCKVIVTGEVRQVLPGVTARACGVAEQNIRSALLLGALGFGLSSQWDMRSYLGESLKTSTAQSKLRKLKELGE